MNPAAAIAFLETLRVPEGPKAGERLKLAPFQRQFVTGALASDVSVAALSIGRGNAKTALSAGIGLGALLGKLGDKQPKREIVIGARTRWTDPGRPGLDARSAAAHRRRPVIQGAGAATDGG